MMTSLQTRPLTEAFGVEIASIDLNEVIDPADFAPLRAAFETHSALLFRDQNITDETHLRLARWFGPIEDREADERPKGAEFRIPKVSNVDEGGGVIDHMDLKALHLKSNMLWHSDSTFMPTPALVNVLTARVVTSTGGATELASTRAAFSRMCAQMQARLRSMRLRHHYSHSRARISVELAKLPMFHKWPEQVWPATWPNPVNGQEAVYVASHAFAIDGLSREESAPIIDDIIAQCTVPEVVYAHSWAVGDVLLWDQRAVLHRGTPWPYSEPRVLSSICASATAADGLDLMRENTATSG